MGHRVLILSLIRRQETHGKLRSLSIEASVLSSQFLIDRESPSLYIILCHTQSEINTRMIGSDYVSPPHTHTHYTMIEKYIANLYHSTERCCCPVRLRRYQLPRSQFISTILVFIALNLYLVIC